MAELVIEHLVPNRPCTKGTSVLYLIDPELSGVASPEAAEFNRTVVDAIGAHQHCAVLSNLNQIESAYNDLASAHGVGFYATTDSDAFDEPLAQFLRRAVDRGAAVVPIAIDPVHRRLPDPVAGHVVFAAYDWLEKRELPPESLASVARLYAWQLLAASRPTFASEDVHVFLSYARGSSEGLARHLAEALRPHGLVPIRDNESLRSGKQVRPEIEAALERSDVFVLLDTPDAHESEWMEWELWTAVKKGIPIVWIDWGAPERKVPTNHQPGSRPDVTVADSNVDVKSLARDVDDIARTKLLGTVPAAQRFIGRLHDWARRPGAGFADLDPQLGMYDVTYPAAPSPYRVPDHRHLVQVFARRPRTDDLEALSNWLGENPRGEGSRTAFDAAIMASTAPHERIESEDGFAVTDSASRYLDNIEAEELGESRTHPGLLVFGALPDQTAASDEVIRAARNVTAKWLRLGGNITFGGHPTITWHVIHGGAEALPSETSQRRIYLYQSAFWPEQPRIAEIKELADVTRVPDVPGDKAASLEHMRLRMIAESDAVAAVTIGGRTDEGGTHDPGVRREALLARAAGIPVFPLGATGGESALLANEQRMASADTERFNDASQAVSAELATTDDYTGATATIWRSVVG